MKTEEVWKDQVVDRDGVKQPVYDLAYRPPDGTQLIVTAGQKVNVYDTNDGEPIQSLKGHKGTVYCVNWAPNGKRFASGGADCQVIIWAEKPEGYAGILKYSHNDSIQCLAYNPITQHLASCTATDFGLWGPEQQAVNKKSVSSKILCCGWTNDGQFLALGHFNGIVSIRDKEGTEKVKIERKAPIWCLAWNPSRDELCDVLAVGDLSQKLSFYQLSGRQISKDRDLGFDPCCIGYFSNGEYLVIGGSDRKVSLWTKEGVRLLTVGERSDWVWVCKVKPRQNNIAVGCNDGRVSHFQLQFSTVHGLYQDRYAYRDYMTDVIVQDLTSEKKLRIKCRDYVKKIAIYRDRMAVQLPSQIVIYELLYDSEDNNEMHYKAKWKIQRSLECNLLVVTSLHIILCQDKKLQLYNFRGEKEREWVLESLIRYIKVVGGPSGREGLLVGLKNGLIIKVFVDNPFPIHLIKQKTSVRCLDLSSSRSKLAVVDENNNCLVYNLHDKELLFQETNANSVAWNTELEDMLCFSGNGFLNIKAGNLPTHQQKLLGFVVGFKGSRIFCLHIYAMQTVEVPQSASLYRYIEKKDFQSAYKIACLGVTDHDWKLLALEALQGMNLEIARKAFIRIRDLRFIELINVIEQAKKRPNYNEQLYLGEILAFQGKYLEAAKAYSASGNVRKAIEMFCDLRDWERAKEWATTTNALDIMELIRLQAQWAEDTGDWKAAVELWVAAGEYIKAVTIYGEMQKPDDLIDMTRAFDKTQPKQLEALEKAASYFRKMNQTQYTIETYLKIGDLENLLELYVEAQQWDEAMKLIENNNKLDAKKFWLPYAHWLAVKDRFEEAQDAFFKAGQPEASSRVLEQLTHNAVVEHRFEDASYYFWLLSRECLKSVQHKDQLTEEDEFYLRRFKEFCELSDIYFAYTFIFRYIDEPFTALHPENVFNIARYLLNAISNKNPLGVSKLYILFTMAKHAKDLGAYKLARQTYEKLQQLRLPNNWIDQIDLASITIRSKPYSDGEDFQPLCYRCNATNPPVGPKGNICVNCKHPFIFSFYSFDVLPLVEFFLEDGISDEEAVRLIEREPPIGGMRPRLENVNTLSLDDPGHDTFDSDLFGRLLAQYEQNARQDALVVDRDVLLSLRKTEVFIQNWNTPAMRLRFFKLIVPETPVILCNSCNHFFHEEDFEMASIQKRRCPICRATTEVTL